MATTSYLGDSLRGTLGNIVVYTLRGKTVYRSKPGPRKNGPSPGQAIQQTKFGLMMKFLKPVCPLLRETFALSAPTMSGFNKALSYNINNAITGDYPDFRINYPMVMMGYGDLPAAAATKVSEKEGFLEIRWTDHEGLTKARSSDLAFIALYSETKKDWIFQMEGPKRSEGDLKIDIKSFGSGTVHLWLGFRSAKNKQVSNGIYIGQVEVG